jgi:hypothetical protein
MINFRFHIVSLTAVFLAFAVGLVLGTTFLDDATERELRRQLEGLDEDLGDARRHTTQLQEQIDRFEEEDDALGGPLGDRLLDGMLAGEPVLVLAPEGLEGEPVEQVVAALGQAGAEHLGTWRLTDRLELDDDDETGDLATALDASDDADAEELREDLISKLATALYLAMHSSDVDDSGGAGAVGTATGTAAEPAIIAALHEQGFIDYEAPEGADGDVVQLPSSGLRVVVVTGPGADVPNEAILLPTLSELVAEEAAPVVVAAPTPTSEDDPENVDGVDSLVAAVRDGDDLSERISTVDNLDLLSGRLAAILALQQADPDDPQIGQYGLGPGAQDLLPALPALPGSEGA